MPTAAPPNNRLLIVSNRLPVTIETTDGRLVFRPSSGGLASGLGACYKAYRASWIGWPGLVASADRHEVAEQLKQGLQCYPVFLSEKLAEKYYEGFTNKTIWPLFHSFPAYTKYSASEWEAYQEANHLFCDAILKIAQADDLVWVHDYHLMLLPSYLREHLPSLKIGFFLHTPFPHYDIFRLLPWHKQIMDSLLGCDLVGFHTYDYLQAFLGSARRISGLDSNIGLTITKHRAVQADVFPIGIDFAKFAKAPATAAVEQEIAKISARTDHPVPLKVIFSVSRLDYTKGIPENLEAIEEFLAQNREWHGKMVYILVIVPSREKVGQYAMLKKHVDEQVGRINSQYGTLDWMPIRYIYRHLTFQELVALYYKADVALVTPLRDGMNLIAKEYLAAKANDQGVLVLGDMAGAAKELLEAIIVNPNSKEEVAVALKQALLMPMAEQIRRNKIMRARLESYDIMHWAGKFLDRLQETALLSQKLAVQMLEEKAQAELLVRYRQASQRLLIFDYDGTLVPFYDRPDQAVPDWELLSVLEKLCASPRNRVVILSGRDRKALGEWFANLNLTLAAEHGGWVRQSQASEWQQSVVPKGDTWKKQIGAIFKLFVDRIPGTFIEDKSFALAWHYRNADPDSAVAAARELLDILSNLTPNLPIQVLPGNKILEVRDIGIGKGTFYRNHLSRGSWDFLLAAGDDATDEELFADLPAGVYSIKVGAALSRATFCLDSHREVRELLKKLAQDD